MLGLRIIPALLACLLSGLAQAQDSPANVNAGVLPFACQNGEAVYLLAYDPNPKRLGWGNFGGGPNHNELAYQTALREFREETNCTFNINEVDPDRLHGPSEFFGYYTFLLNVPFVSPVEISRSRNCESVERSQWVWVQHEPFTSALSGFDPRAEMPVKSGEPDQIHLWDGSAGSLRKALADGVIPSRDPCVDS